MTTNTTKAYGCVYLRDQCAMHAAAPDLLAALEEAIPILEAHTDEWAYRHYERTLNAARAAIARAKGEQP